ncbi:hypothetical protein ABSL23_05480 [Halobacterium sp. NMX12-1]|uniref:DUF5667 domain-containing protein n=1 Tax=Halobacterium sp. NMX12-1 TaxID=3166650 RepID=A0AAU8CFI0_9EURY
MKATVLLVTALLVVGAAAPMAVAASTADGSAAADAVMTQEEDAANGTDNETETAPGARLAGVVGVQGAEVEGEVEQRSLRERLRAANSNASKASVVANQTRTLDQRLEELRERKQELEAARENIPPGRYRGEVAGLAARISTLQAMSNETADTARSLPAGELEAHGVNVSALDRLRTSASNLSGPEVAAIARDIAGPPGNRSAGPPFGNGMGGPPSDVPGADEDNETDGGPGNAPGAPGNAPANPGNDSDAGNATDDDTAGPSVDAPGNDSDANTTETNDGSDADGGDANAGGADSGGDAGPPDDAGNGNDSPGRSLVDWSALAALLP